MTSQCKSVLSGIKNLSNNTELNVSYLYDTSCFCLDADQNKTFSYQKYENEIESIISALVSEGYLKYNYGNEYNFCLTQKGIHVRQFTFASVKAYFADKLIDILALIISIIALCKSYGYGIEDFITSCTKLLERLWK